MTLVPIAMVSFYTHEGPGTGGSVTDNVYVTYLNENGQLTTLDTSSASFISYSSHVKFHAHPTGDDFDPWEDDILEYEVRYSPMFQNLYGQGFRGSVHLGNNTSDAVLEYDLNLLFPVGSKASNNPSLNNEEINKEIIDNAEYMPSGGFFENMFNNLMIDYQKYMLMRQQAFSNNGAFGWLTPQNLYLGPQYYGEKIGEEIGGYWGGKAGRFFGDLIGLVGGGVVGLIEGVGFSIGYAAATGDILAPLYEGYNLGKSFLSPIIEAPSMAYMIGEKTINSVMSGKNQFTDEDINKIIDWGTAFVLTTPVVLKGGATVYSKTKGFLVRNGIIHKGAYIPENYLNIRFLNHFTEPTGKNPAKVLEDAVIQQERVYNGRTVGVHMTNSQGFMDAVKFTGAKVLPPKNLPKIRQKMNLHDLYFSLNEPVKGINAYGHYVGLYNELRPIEKKYTIIPNFSGLKTFALLVDAEFNKPALFNNPYRKISPYKIENGKIVLNTEVFREHHDTYVANAIGKFNPDSREVVGSDIGQAIHFEREQVLPVGTTIIYDPSFRKAKMIYDLRKAKTLPDFHEKFINTVNYLNKMTDRLEKYRNLKNNIYNKLPNPLRGIFNKIADPIGNMYVGKNIYTYVKITKNPPWYFPEWFTEREVDFAITGDFGLISGKRRKYVSSWRLNLAYYYNVFIEGRNYRGDFIGNMIEKIGKRVPYDIKMKIDAGLYKAWEPFGTIYKKVEIIPGKVQKMPTYEKIQITNVDINKITKYYDYEDIYVKNIWIGEILGKIGAYHTKIVNLDNYPSLINQRINIDFNYHSKNKKSYNKTFADTNEFNNNRYEENIRENYNNFGNYGNKYTGNYGEKHTGRYNNSKYNNSNYKYKGQYSGKYTGNYGGYIKTVCSSPPYPILTEYRGYPFNEDIPTPPPSKTIKNIREKFKISKLPIHIKKPDVKKNKRTWFLRDLLNPNKAFKDMEETVAKSIKNININIKI